MGERREKRPEGGIFQQQLMILVYSRAGRGEQLIEIEGRKGLCRLSEEERLGQELKLKSSHEM